MKATAVAMAMTMAAAVIAGGAGAPRVIPGGGEYGATNYVHKVPRPWANRGVDYDKPIGTKVIAAADGEVYQVTHFLNTDHDVSLGAHVVINHTGEAEGLRTRSTQLNRVIARTGQIVKAGDVIGIVGNSGCEACVTHLHFEVWTEDGHVDPATKIGGCHGSGTPKEEGSPSSTRSSAEGSPPRGVDYHLSDGTTLIAAADRSVTAREV